LGLFHWFDANPYIKFEYEGALETDSAAVRESFENMLGNYIEKETRSDFISCVMALKFLVLVRLI
jgi:hypothetical protein